MICQRKSDKNNNGALGYKFWNSPTYKEDYKAQIVCARRLIKEFGDKAVIGFLTGNGKNIYSLGRYHPMKFVKEAIAKFKDSMPVEQIVEPKIKTEDIKADEAPRKQFVNKKGSLFSKIKKAEVNNGEKES